MTEKKTVEANSIEWKDVKRGMYIFDLGAFMKFLSPLS